MTIRHIAGALLCALALSTTAQQPLSTPKFRDRTDRNHYWSLSAPDGFDTLRLTPTTDKHGAVSQLRYRTTAGLDCETFVSGGQLIIGRVRNPWLHRRPKPLAQILVPESHGGILALPVVPFCPVLTSR